MKDYQQVLFPYAYNILGSAEDARDAVQDVLSNYFSADRQGIENETGYLVKSVIHQSINIKNKKKAVPYDPVWLPEPIATEEADQDMHLRDIGSYSMLILLEQLNPKERAVFILKEGFGYSHEEIASVISGTVEMSRKLLSRAKAKLEQSRQPMKLLNSKNAAARLLDQYLNAIRGGDVKTLEGLLSKDIKFVADGGPHLNVVKKLCTGTQEVADLLVFVYNKYQSKSTVVEATINHQPALLYYNAGVLYACQVFTIAEDNSILQISTVLDPEKLKHIHLN
ncbi:sigma factor-like helix-turn-helix DNA-binding protein [Chitinophaga tropicalis]|uniref:RNA polymerase subunit sigma-24 n=1 Tax=Chitinophaga tropicalis TaxID=2683588 RepID=A0A7K1U808_9BACT|nr:sigma factor-like helix-turn-helix DNA-binding protein [Chitinophaga tropicalis]MVT10503.1 RNA polymerase subunit sigma-24 [Chitinophaga tropicalis]